MRMILGIDAGNHQVKIVGPYGEAAFLSNICGYFERQVNHQGKDDMVFEYEGVKGFAGTLAAREDEFGGGVMYGDSKAHEDAKLRILIGLHRYCNDGDEVYMVTGQPILKHTDAEKEKIKNMLKGSHDITINGIEKTIRIIDVAIAPEGSAAFWANPREGAVKILDIGSGTVNAASIRDKLHINQESYTFVFGTETINNARMENMAFGIIRNISKKWPLDSKIDICGGAAEQIEPIIKNHYQNTSILRPAFRYNGGVKHLHPMFANASGYYAIAKGMYER